ncbi:MAG: restriction endonuclease [Bacteroidales bacterium]|nr:restriction endonuclease [Bacteroidales bacterium]
MIKEFLNNINEDDFIEKIVIPLFSSQGYFLYRIYDHGPGEHGKDIIFYRHVQLFYDNEYIAIQAKSEKLTTSNVQIFSSQIIRALKISFNSKSGPIKYQPNYAIFINAKTHTNDANIEFTELVKEYPNIKILSQENVCELILKTGIAPNELFDKLSKNLLDELTTSEKLIYETILKGTPSEIDNLFDLKLKLLKDQINQGIKELIINYIYERWQQDQSWEGTVKPMKWFNIYFEYFQTKQYEYLFDIFNEFTSTTPSYKAADDVKSIINKITPEIINNISSKFIKYSAEQIFLKCSDKKEYFVNKLYELYDSKSINETAEKTLLEEIIEILKIKNVDIKIYHEKRIKLVEKLFGY